MALNKTRFCSWNVRGLRGKVKQRKVFALLKKNRVDVALLQESHLEDREHLKLTHSWAGQAYFSSFTSSSRGVVILINKNLQFKIITCIKDKYGRFVIVKGLLRGEEITIMNLYCPPNYTPDFFNKSFF